MYCYRGVMEKRQTLKERYNDDFLQQAEMRREKLAYKRVSVGLVTNERTKYLLELLYQAHQCYYFGLFNASINLGASLLEQSIIVLFEELLLERGEVQMKNYKNMLVYLPNWLGDIIMCYPAIENIKKQMPQTSISVMGKKSMTTIFIDNPIIDKIIDVEEYKQVNKDDYDGTNFSTALPS